MDGQNMTLGDFLDKWLETAVKNNVRLSTYTSYKGYIENHIKRLIGDRLLAEIKTGTIQQFVYDLSAERKLSERTIGIIATMLSGVLACAEDYEYIIRSLSSQCGRTRLNADRMEGTGTV
jgi:hypothetical protein